MYTCGSPSLPIVCAAVHEVNELTCLATEQLKPKYRLYAVFSQELGSTLLTHSPVVYLGDVFFPSSTFSDLGFPAPPEPLLQSSVGLSDLHTC